jgi:hypothetical protein
MIESEREKNFIIMRIKIHQKKIVENNLHHVTSPKHALIQPFFP